MTDAGRVQGSRFSSLALVAALLASSAAMAEGGCRTVHGRLSLYNGAPSARIWLIGTKRVLGVSSEGAGESKLPDDIRARWGDPFKNDLFGDFHVCAVTPSHPGWMQIVRLEGGKNLRRVDKFR